MPLDFHILTEDRVTGQVAPLGHITGFPRPHIRSPWPDNPTGKPLTDRRIARYAKAGKYFAIHEAVKKQKAKSRKQSTIDFA